MDPFTPRKNKKGGPEQIIQDGIIKKLRSWDWLVISTHGNMYQMGLPDLYCAHTKYGVRWIEVKNLANHSFTPAQIEMFPAMHAKGVGIWILVADTDIELAKLFEPANWFQYFFRKLV